MFGRYAGAVIKLLLIDIDGTLVGQGARIDECVPPVLELARRAGVCLALCTGRPLYGIAQEYASLVNGQGLHIFQNGSVISRANGEIGRVESIDQASFEGMIRAARAAHTPLEVYTPTALHIEAHDQFTLHHAQLLNLKPIEGEDLTRLEGPVVRLQWVVPESRLTEVQGITARFPDLELNSASQMDMPGIVFASVTRKGTSKTSAAAWLAATLGADLSAVAMVGDGDGDLDLIGAAGLGIAMGNATSGVKAAADVVVADVDHGGLVEAVELVLSRNLSSAQA